MRKIILITVLFFITAVTVTAFYFSKIKQSGQNTENVISQIPQNAALVFEFKNDREFYDLFKENPLLTSFIGQKKTNELQYFYDNLIRQGTLKAALSNRSIFISLHPALNPGNLNMLILANAEGINNWQETLNLVLNNLNGAYSSEKIGNKTIQEIYFSALKEAFYISYNAGVLAGSFDKALLLDFLDERAENKINNLTQLSDQQNKNSIANLYVNYRQFPALFKQLFHLQDDDFFRLLNHFPANAALSLNYKSDALLFNGYTQTDTAAATYLNLFLKQQPVKNSIKAIYPINTASAISFAYDQTAGFLKELDNWQIKRHDDLKAKALFKLIREETGVSIQTAFRKQLGKEFAVITTAENEKVAVVKVKNGSELEPFLRNISVEPDSLNARLKYENLPYYLLGEPLLHFKQPYFSLIDNYLLLSNSKNEITRFLGNYHQQHFLNQEQQYYDFDRLLSDQSNISFFIDLPNAFRILKNNLQPGFKQAFSQENSGWKNYYAAALQFTASQNNFYTNFYLQQSKPKTVKRDTTAF